MLVIGMGFDTGVGGAEGEARGAGVEEEVAEGSGRVG